MLSVLTRVGAIALLLLCLGMDASSSRGAVQTVSGRVLHDEAPLAGAVVRIQATAISAASDSDGRFELIGIMGNAPLVVTAWKAGFYIEGVEASPGDQNAIIRLDPYPEHDYQYYAWISPEPPPEEKANCSGCHPQALGQWKSNLHSQAAVDPLVLMMYNGTDIEGNPGIEPGFRIDYPGALGSCANCHAPTAALKDGSWATDMNSISGVDRNGVFCDYCHKIIATTPDSTGSRPGFLSIELRRPDPTTQLFLGTFDDSPGKDSYHPLYGDSTYCAPCHQYYNNRVLIYSSYPEWARSRYAAEGIDCQACHMKPDGITTNIAPDKGGVERAASTIPSHMQMGPDAELFIAEALGVSTTASVQDRVLEIAVSIENRGGGHHIPTGNPMRNMLLLVDAEDQDDTALRHLSGDRLPEWAGLGSGPDDYAGAAGKGFAKILEDQDGIFPAPQWRVAFIKEDSRIPAHSTDVSRYRFAIPEGTKKITVTATLIFRKTFKPWADAKGWPAEDYVVGMDSVELQCSETETSTRTLCTPITD